MFKKILVALTLAMASVGYAQQPQANDIPPTQPIFSTNAKMVNGAAPGYWPTANSTGLTLNVSAGTSFFVNTLHKDGPQTLTLTNNTTNYVYLDMTTGALAFNTSGFASSEFPIAVVVTSGGNIIAPLFDVRTMFNDLGAGGGGGGCTPSGTTGFFIQKTGSSTCGAAFIDEGVTNANTITITDQNIALTANGTDGIVICTDTTGSDPLHCPTTGTAPITLDSMGTLTLLSEVDIQINATDNMVLESITGWSVHDTRALSMVESGTGGMNYDDSGGGGISITENTEGGVDGNGLVINTSGGFDISSNQDNNGGDIGATIENTYNPGSCSGAGNCGLNLNDDSVDGIYIDESGTGQISEAANVINLIALSGAAQGIRFHAPSVYIPVLFSTLPACSPTNSDGMTASITDASTQIWGATVTGTGTPATPYTKVFCDGVNWTVEAK